MKYLSLFVLTLAFVLGAACPSHAQSDWVRSVESFDFLVDYSGSMMMTHGELKENKMELAKEILTRINRTLPPLGYRGAVHTFAPPATILPLEPWQPATMQMAIDSLQSDLPIFGRTTPMGYGLAQLSYDYGQMPRPTAIIMVSDGDANTGVNPVSEALNLYRTQPGLCLHIISLADEPADQATLERIAALNPCSVMADGADLLEDEGALRSFVEQVFYNVVVEEAFILRGVNFAFDSYTLDNQAMAILNEVAFMLRSTPGARITLEGWTDSLGTDSYNMVLSQRRADAVRDYLIWQGIPGFSMRSVGMGKSFKYDNDSEQGRYLNRRTELIFE